MRFLRVICVLIVTGVCVAFIADGGIFYLVLPLAGLGAMEIAAVFEPRCDDASGP